MHANKTTIPEDSTEFYSYGEIECEGGVYSPVQKTNQQCRLVSDGVRNVFYFGKDGLFDKVSSPHGWHTFKFIKTNEVLNIRFVPKDS